MIIFWCTVRVRDGNLTALTKIVFACLGYHERKTILSKKLHIWFYIKNGRILRKIAILKMQWFTTNCQSYHKSSKFSKAYIFPTINHKTLENIPTVTTNRPSYLETHSGRFVVTHCIPKFCILRKMRKNIFDNAVQFSKLDNTEGIFICRTRTPAKSSDAHLVYNLYHMNHAY